MDRYDWVDDNGADHGMVVRGHRLLVRKCLRNDEDFLVGEPKCELDDEARLMIEGMMRSERMVPQQKGIRGTNWCSVLAIGEAVGSMRSKSWAKSHDGDYGTVLPCSVGDFVVLPETSGTGQMWRGVTGSVYDLLVDVSEIIAWMPDMDEAMPIPVGKRLLVLTDEDSQERDGISIPDIGTDRAMTGTVYELGTGQFDKHGNIQDFAVGIGQSVVFERIAGIDANINGVKYNILKESEIKAVLGTNAA